MVSWETKNAPVCLWGNWVKFSHVRPVTKHHEQPKNVTSEEKRWKPKEKVLVYFWPFVVSLEESLWEHLRFLRQSLKMHLESAASRYCVSRPDWTVVISPNPSNKQYEHPRSCCSWTSCETQPSCSFLTSTPHSEFPHTGIQSVIANRSILSLSRQISADFGTILQKRALKVFKKTNRE